ncbi:MAG: Prolyl oligopeptidase N-terminal beta-propeller domain [Chloroflexota bacterium]|jgi:hypothetical protein
MSNRPSLKPRPRGERIPPRPFHSARQINPPASGLLDATGGWRGRGPRLAPLIASLLLLSVAVGTGYAALLALGPGETAAEGPEVAAGAAIEGTIAVARDGAIIGVSGESIVVLTAGPTDRDVAWSRDGSQLYFVRLREAEGGRRNESGSYTRLHLSIPSLYRASSAGGSATLLLDGLVKGATTAYDNSGFIFDPAPAPDGRIALATDLKGSLAAPALGSDVIIRYLGASGSVSAAGFPDLAPYGHQDPAWSASGDALYYVQNGFSSEGSASRIIRYDVASDTTRRFSERGFVEPAPSPDGRWIAATRISAKGSDVVVLDAATGAVAAEVTRTGRSWSPAWSPDGARLAFLIPDGSAASLQVATISVVGGIPTIPATLRLLRDPVDPNVRPAWGPLVAVPSATLP